MNPRIFLFPCFILSVYLLSGQHTFVRTTAKINKAGIHHIKILTEDKLAPVLLVNESEKEGALTDWYIFVENGGSIHLRPGDSLNRIMGRAQLGQQYAEIKEVGTESDPSYHWEISTPTDTLILGGFNPTQEVELACLLYKQMNQEIISEDQAPYYSPKKKLIPLLRFSYLKTNKSRLYIFETGQLSDYPYLAKILGAFLATLKLLDRL